MSVCVAAHILSALFCAFVDFCVVVCCLHAVSVDAWWVSTRPLSRARVSQAGPGMRDVEWATVTCPITWETSGAWPDPLAGATAAPLLG
jgi:hypothetical protein